MPRLWVLRDFCGDKHARVLNDRELSTWIDREVIGFFLDASALSASKRMIDRIEVADKIVDSVMNGNGDDVIDEIICLAESLDIQLICIESSAPMLRIAKK